MKAQLHELKGADKKGGATGLTDSVLSNKLKTADILAGERFPGCHALHLAPLSKPLQVEISNTMSERGENAIAFTMSMKAKSVEMIYKTDQSARQSGSVFQHDLQLCKIDLGKLKQVYLRCCRQIDIRE